MTSDATRHAIVDAVTRLASALGISVIAEGVEHPEQTRALLELGCTEAQGFLYSEPVAAARLAAAVSAQDTG